MGPQERMPPLLCLPSKARILSSWVTISHSPMQWCHHREGRVKTRERERSPAQPQQGWASDSPSPQSLNSDCQWTIKRIHSQFIPLLSSVPMQTGAITGNPDLNTKDGASIQWHTEPYSISCNKPIRKMNTCKRNLRKLMGTLGKATVL